MLLALGQEAMLCKNVQSFLRILILGAPGYIAFESLKKYLQCQGMVHCEMPILGEQSIFNEFYVIGIMRLSTLVLIILSPINVILNIILVHHTRLGLLGSPLALSIIYWLAFLLLGLFTAFSPHHRRNKTWDGWNIREAIDLRGVRSFLVLALPGILMVGTEW